MVIPSLRLVSSDLVSFDLVSSDLVSSDFSGSCLGSGVVLAAFLALAFFKISEADGIDDTGAIFLASIPPPLPPLVWLLLDPLLALIKFFKDCNSWLISPNSSLIFSFVKCIFFSILLFKLSISNFINLKSSSNFNLSLLYLFKKSLTFSITVSISDNLVSLACLISSCSKVNWSNILSIFINSSLMVSLSLSIDDWDGGIIDGIK